MSPRSAERNTQCFGIPLSAMVEGTKITSNVLRTDLFFLELEEPLSRSASQASGTEVAIHDVTTMFVTAVICAFRVASLLVNTWASWSCGSLACEVFSSKVRVLHAIFGLCETAFQAQMTHGMCAKTGFLLRFFVTVSVFTKKTSSQRKEERRERGRDSPTAVRLRSIGQTASVQDQVAAVCLRWATRHTGENRTFLSCRTGHLMSQRMSLFWKRRHIPCCCPKHVKQDWESRNVCAKARSHWTTTPHNHWKLPDKQRPDCSRFGLTILYSTTKCVTSLGRSCHRFLC